MSKGTLRVMLVDDDPIEGELFGVSIRRDRLDVAVEQFQDAEAALAALEVRALRQDLPDVLLLDVNMPGMNGFEFLSRLRSDGRVGYLPVIAYTSSSLRPDIDRMRSGSCAAYLQKPADFEGLRGLVHDLVRWLREGAELQKDLLQSA